MPEAERRGRQGGAAGTDDGAVRGRAKVFGGGWVVRSAGNASRCVEVRKCSGRACRCVGWAEVFGGEGLWGRRGMHRAACGRVSALRGGAEVLGKGASLCGGGRRCCEGECVVRPAGVRLGCGGGRKCSGRARRCAGTGADLRRGMGGEVGGFNALSPQPLARTRIIIYTSIQIYVHTDNLADKKDCPFFKSPFCIVVQLSFLYFLIIKIALLFSLTAYLLWQHFLRYLLLFLEWLSSHFFLFSCTSSFFRQRCLICTPFLTLVSGLTVVVSLP